MADDSAPRYAEIIHFLAACGARELEHPGGTLLDHLERTARTLTEWGATDSLVTAGLCHAAYGTDGFPVALVPLGQRAELIGLIGADAERIVYRYGSCDRAFLYPQLGQEEPVSFRDRFTNDTTVLEDGGLEALVELTFANELDVLTHNADLAAQHGAALGGLFQRCQRFVSPAAYRAFTDSPFAP